MPRTPGDLFDYVDAPYTDYAGGTADRPTGVQEFQRQVESLIAGIRPPVVLDADDPNATNTLAALDLSWLVESGRLYKFEIVLWTTDSDAEGLQMDLAGGTAAMTMFRAFYQGYDETGQMVMARHATALTDLATADIFSGIVIIKGSFQPSGNGSFIPRFAQINHNVGSIIALKGSSLSAEAA